MGRVLTPKWLRVPNLKATVQMPTMNVPFAITIDYGEPEIQKFREIFGDYLYYQSESKRFSLEEMYAAGQVDYYDQTHGHLDGSKFTSIPLRGIMWGWPSEDRQTMILSAVAKNQARYCWSGWGTMKIRVVGSLLNIPKIECKFKTQLVKKL